MSFYEINTNGLIYMRSTIIGAKHAFTTRFGGVSRGAFASLNLASEKGDDPEAVCENFRRVCALFGTDENGACTARQVHQNQVRVVTSADKHSCLAPAAIEADGLVTAEKGLPVFCFAADCTPMLLWDTENRAVGAIHCSWRNSVMDMPGRAVAAMGALGAGPEKLCAALGPALGRCHFETDDDACPRRSPPGSAATTRAFSTGAPTARPWSICARPTPGGSSSSASRRRTSTSPASVPSAATTNTGRTAM